MVPTLSGRLYTLYSTSRGADTVWQAGGEPGDPGRVEPAGLRQAVYTVHCLLSTSRGGETVWQAGGEPGDPGRVEPAGLRQAARELGGDDVCVRVGPGRQRAHGLQRLVRRHLQHHGRGTQRHGGYRWK